MIKPFYFSLSFFFLVIILCVVFPFCNDHQSIWCEQIWEPLVIAMATEMLHPNWYGLVWGALLDVR